MALRFDGRVVVVTGAGNGLGRAHALDFGRRGAKVVVNDLGSKLDGEGASSSAADKVVEEIRASGGAAVASYDSVENGARIIQTAIDAFGRVDIVVNNAGILRDRSFEKMTDTEWKVVLNVHLQGTYAVTKAAWPYLKKQKYGRVIMTSSTSGLYGSFGQANYAAAKLALVGLSHTLSKEGLKYNILVNAIAPHSETRMSAGLFSEEMQPVVTPDKISPLVTWLCHESCSATGQIYELSGGLFTKVRYQRSPGFYVPGLPTAEQVRDNFSKLDDFTDADYPTIGSSITPRLMANVNKTSQTVNVPQIFSALKTFFDRGEGRSTVSRVGAVFRFDIRNGDRIESYTLDMMNQPGGVTKGRSQADVIVAMSEESFIKLITGSLQVPVALLTRQLRFRGRWQMARRFSADLFPELTAENLAKYSSPSL